MNALKRLISFAYDNFGPILIYAGLHRAYGARVAVIGSLAFAAVEIAIKLRRGTPFTGFFKFTVAITAVFGILDLTLTDATFGRFESVLTNLVTAGYFGMTLRGPRSFIQEWAEKKRGSPLTDPNAILRCQMLTVVWTAYFVLKAGFYTWANLHYSWEQAMVLRSVVGTASFYALLGWSIFFGRSTLERLQAWGCLPRVDAVAALHYPRDSCKTNI
jgi:uncharacterized membrane protein